MDAIKNGTGVWKSNRRRFLQGIAAGAVTLGGLPMMRARAAETTLKLWAASGQRWEFANRGIVPLFEKVHPDVKVEITATPIGNFGSKVAAAMAAGSTEWDVIQLDYAQVPQFAAAQWIAPLDQWINADPAYKASLKDIPDPVLGLYQLDGHQWGIPADSNAMMTYYRADVLDKYGMKPPQTWDEAVEIAREFRSKGTGQYGYIGSLARGLFAYLGLLPVLWSYGGEIWDEKTFEIKIDKGDEGVKALSVMKELIKYGDPVSVNATDDEQNNSMASGTSVVAPSAWGNTVMTNKKFSRYWDVIKTTTVPAGKPGLRVPAMGGLGHMVVGKSQHKDLAWEYVKLVTSDDKAVGRAWVDASGQPSRISILTDPTFSAEFPYFSTLADTLKIARRYGGGIPEAYAIADVIGTVVSSIITGQIEVEPGVKKIGDDTFAFLKQNGYPTTR
jgi:multiple sugar transport system substrate-binding protein